MYCVWVLVEQDLRLMSLKCFHNLSLMLTNVALAAIMPCWATDKEGEMKMLGKSDAKYPVLKQLRKCDLLMNVRNYECKVNCSSDMM